MSFDPTPRTCVVCESTFTPKRGNHRRCSPRCTKAGSRYTPETAARRGTPAFANRAARYGMTVDELDMLLSAAKCAACGSTDSRRHEWHIDHDHKCCPSRAASCGRCVRGLLCQACNLSLGQARDSVARLKALVEYLERGGAETPAPSVLRLRCEEVTGSGRYLHFPGGDIISETPPPLF
ncbi:MULTISPECIES: endonuclease domain-containing protein [Bacteria]|uniref:endonuclease domain-containing protein n=1 Tax=Bacteria TaxID=2 RepID=UPI003C79AD18